MYFDTRMVLLQTLPIAAIHQRCAISSSQRRHLTTVYGLIQDYVLYNACTGEAFLASDPRCPMRSIVCLITPGNVYANLCGLEALHTMTLNVLDTRRQALFAARNPLPLLYAAGYHSFPVVHRFHKPNAEASSVCRKAQSRTIDGRACSHGSTNVRAILHRYVRTSIGLAAEIDKTVTAAIKACMRRWRSNSQSTRVTGTTFQPDVCDALQSLLPLLEQWKLDGGRTTREHAHAYDHEGEPPVLSCARLGFTWIPTVAIDGGLEWIKSQVDRRLEAAARTKRIRGFPLHTPFTDVGGLVEKVGLCTCDK
jgi:hypothetical protein